MASPTINTMTSFSGADLVVTFANQVIGELQQISWAIQREKAPVYTLGSADARSFSRGKRGIAGSMVFAVFDHDSLVSALQRVWGDIAPAAMFTAAGNSAVAKSEAFEDALNMLKWNVKTGSNVQNGYGYSGKSAISANTAVGSNGAPVLGEDGYFVESWQQGETINVPTGFEPIRGGSVL